MRVTALIENKASDTDSNLVSEWGLSLHIAFKHHYILFDTGASAVFAQNAERLGVDLGAVEAALLSHHHYDHRRGVTEISGAEFDCAGYLRSESRRRLLAKIDIGKYIGLDKALFDDYSNRFVFVREPREILPDVFILPHILSAYPSPRGNKRLYLKRNGSSARGAPLPRDRRGDQGRR